MDQIILPNSLQQTAFEAHYSHTTGVIVVYKRPYLLFSLIIIGQNLHQQLTDW